MNEFNFGPRVMPGSDAHGDLSGILHGSYERDVLMPRDAKVVVDVGANVGAFSLWAQRTFESATILALEPQLDAYRILEENMATCERSILLPLAASNKSGFRHLYRGVCTLGESSLEDIGQQHCTDYVVVQTVRLDAILPLPPDILKIDTEGHELSVLDGMSRWDINELQYVAMEVHRKADEPQIVQWFKGRSRLRVVYRELESGNPDRILIGLAV